MKRHDMEQIELGGLAGNLTHYKIDGKRVTRDEYDAIRHSAKRLECLGNANKNGVWHFYAVAVME